MSKKDLEGFPEKPDHLGEHGEKLWDTLVPQLFEQGLVTDIDASQLEGLCSWWQSYKELKAAWIEGDDPAATVKLFYMMRSSWQEYSRLGRQFGLSALARSALRAPTTAEDDLEEFN